MPNSRYRLVTGTFYARFNERQLHDIIDIISESKNNIEFRLSKNPEDMIVLPDNV